MYSYNLVKIKNELGISEEIELEKLFDRIFEYRNRFHPDKYQNEEMRKNANTKFIEISEVLDELKMEMDKEVNRAITYGENALDLYDKYYNFRSDKLEIVELQKKVNELTQQLDKKMEIIKKVYQPEKKEIKDKFVNESSEINAKLSVNKNNIKLFGGMFAFTTLLYIMQQFSFVKGFILGESFINSSMIQYFMTVTICICLLWIILKFYAEKTYSKWIQYTKTSDFRFLYFDYCNENNKEITEKSIIEFIKIQLQKDKLFVVLCERVFFIKSSFLFEMYKDNFLYWALQKKYIKYDVTTKGLHRYKLSDYDKWSKKENEELVLFFNFDDELNA